MQHAVEAVGMGAVVEARQQPARQDLALRRIAALGLHHAGGGAVGDPAADDLGQEGRGHPGGGAQAAT
jgi:hypothetical protein